MGKPRDEKSLEERPAEQRDPGIDEIEQAVQSRDLRIIKKTVDRVFSPDIQDIWHETGGESSHWILLLNGIDDADERQLVSELLIWQHCNSGPDARVRCLQSSEREEFDVVTRHFGVTAPPVLAISNSGFLQPFITVNSELLVHLLRQDNGIRRFLTKVHISLMHNRTLEALKAEIYTAEFWQALKIGFKEVKSLLSIKIGLGGIHIGVGD
jgi:hypothetical protein